MSVAIHVSHVLSNVLESASFHVRGTSLGHQFRTPHGYERVHHRPGFVNGSARSDGESDSVLVAIGIAVGLRRNGRGGQLGEQVVDTALDGFNVRITAGIVRHQVPIDRESLNCGGGCIGGISSGGPASTLVIGINVIAILNFVEIPQAFVD